jgi:hypothetical protein
VLTGASRKKSKKMKIDAELALAVPTPCSGSLSAADFDKYEREIKHPLIVKDDLIDPSEHVNKKYA